jgi:hypothetical protein
MPLAARRVRQAGLVGPAPVARTATTAAAAAVVAHGLGRRTERPDNHREDRTDRRFRAEPHTRERQDEPVPRLAP